MNAPDATTLRDLALSPRFARLEPREGGRLHDLSIYLGELPYRRDRDSESSLATYSGDLDTIVAQAAGMLRRLDEDAQRTAMAAAIGGV